MYFWPKSCAIRFYMNLEVSVLTISIASRVYIEYTHEYEVKGICVNLFHIVRSLH